MTELDLTGYEPREQFTPFHHRDQRWASLVVHRRGGKTVSCVNEMITRATYTTKKRAAYAYIAPFYRQAKDVAWEYFKEYGEPVTKKVRESELRLILFNNATITLYGADNPDALRGLYFDGVILDEYGDCRPSLWGKVVLPTLIDRKGWAVFIGTPKGRNHFFQVHTRAKKAPNWYDMTLPVSVSGLIDPEELEEMKAQMTEEEWKQEMECDFDAAVQGTYYSEIISALENSGQITPTQAVWDPDHPVFVAADLGYADETAFWFWQPHVDGYAIIDFYEAGGVQLDVHLEELKKKPYDYGTIFLPHDARATTLQTGKSTIEQVVEFFRNSTDTNGNPTVIEILPRLDIQHGIDAVRMVLPRCYFNQVACYDGIEALRAHRKSYDEVKKCYSDRPVKDWTSDPADAFRYLAMACRPHKVEHIPKRKQVVARPEYKLKDLWEDDKPGHRYAKLRM